MIDMTTFTLYVVSQTWENGVPVYRPHRLWLSDLRDVTASVIIRTTQALSDGSTTTSQPQSQRQRAALLLSQNKVYAAFGSFCDLNTNASRVWLFGFDSQSLGVVGAGFADMQTAAQAGKGLILGWTTIYYLSSIWMSGFGPSADASGNVYVLTGNSNGNRNAHFPDSAPKIAPNINALVDYFTLANFATLDLNDQDFVAGASRSCRTSPMACNSPPRPARTVACS